MRYLIAAYVLIVHLFSLFVKYFLLFPVKSFLNNLPNLSLLYSYLVLLSTTFAILAKKFFVFLSNYASIVYLFMLFVKPWKCGIFTTF
jgi:hypothetical protein